MRKTDDFEHRVSKSIEASIAVKQRLLGSREVVSTVAKVSEILAHALNQGNKLLCFGNGGSAADAQHIAAEFVGRFAFDRPALPALALSVNTSCVTAIGMTTGSIWSFHGRLRPWGVPGMSRSASRPAATQRMCFAVYRLRRK
jgi:D-sedoheptulose 7-phosphate isomerase